MLTRRAAASVAVVLIAAATGAAGTVPAGGSATHGKGPGISGPLRPVCKSGRHSTRRHPCVRAPRNAVRPRGRSQQGGPNAVVPAPTGSGLGAAGFDREESAITWARGLLRNTHFAWYCESFVESAFNVRDKYKTAWAAAQAIGLNRGRKPPRGALVFFRPDKLNRGYGHVGIALGNGRMISALDAVEESDLNQEYWRDRYAGWAYAPDDWEGRLLIPAPPDPDVQTPSTPTTPDSPTEPPVVVPAPTIRLTGPAAGTTVSGTVVLTAHVENASGVAFDAFYASNPSDANTVGWHRLGLGTPSSNGDWILPFDTKAISDQGNPAWGTVNIMATALTPAGALTAAQDVHRVTVSNPAPPTAPQPPPPASYAYHVVGTCGEGACGLKKRTGPGYSTYPQVGVVFDGQQIDIVCQTSGEAVAGRRSTSTIWDKLTDGTYVSDYYTDTPVFGGFSNPPIPHC